MIALHLRNRQRTRPVQLRLLRRITCALLRELGAAEPADLGVYLVGTPEITRLNETHLRHAGPTDVITFDHADPARPTGLHGETFICVDEAVRQARRYRTSWQSEVVRYLVHGVLHLQGHDDQRTSPRRRMRRAETRLLEKLSREFVFTDLGRRASPGTR